MKYEILKVIPKRSFAFYQQIKKSKVSSKNYSKLPFVFLTTKYKIWSRTQTAIWFFDYKQQN